MAFQLLFVIWRSRVTHPSYRRLIKSGKRLPKGAIFSDEITPYPYIRARDIKAGRIYVDELAFLTKEVQKRIAQYIVNTNDVVITIVGASVGDVGFVTPELNGFNLTENAVRLTGFSKCVNPRYLLYVLNSKKYWELMQQIAGGSAQPKLGIYKIESIPLELPSIEKQNSIVELLSTYDNLIENNQKQIKLLEEAAQRLYKEWFVDLRFPGHEDVQIVDGVPDRWSEKSMDEIADYLNGYAFKPSDWGERGKPIIKIKELNEGVTKDTPRNSGDSIPKKYTIYSGDIVFSWSATLTAKIWDAEEGLLNQHLFKVTPNKGICREYVLQSILKTLDEFSYLTTGSTMKHIQRGKLKQVFVKVPTQDIMNKFEVLADTYREQILTLKHQLILIQEARDRLLPKLMSGEIEL